MKNNHPCLKLRQLRFCRDLLPTILLILLPIAMCAQQRLFTLEDLNFGGTNYHNLRPKNMQLAWWGDQLVHLDVEQCSLIDQKTGQEKLMFTLDDINRWAQSDDQHYVRHLQSASFPYPDQPLVAVGNKRSFMLVDFKAGQVVWQDSLSGQYNNEWSAKSRATAYIEDHQLWVVDADGQKTQLTTDGSHDIVYGEAVHRNEWGIEKGLFWSPDGQRLAFYRMDQSMVTDYPQVSIDHRIAQTEPDKYPMAGMESHVVTIGIYDLRTRQTLYLQTPKGSTCGDSVATSTPIYFTNLTWGPDSKNLYIQELNRDQNDCQLVSYDATTGQRLAELYRETSTKYVEPQHPIQFLPWDNTKFIMQSQRDGYNHLYLYNINGELLRQLTNGSWVVMELIGFNKKSKSVIIASNEKHPLQRNIYEVDINTGRRTLLDNGEGVHRAILSDSGFRLYDKYSTPYVPNNIDVTEMGIITVKSNRPHFSSTRLLTAPDPWEEYDDIPYYECGKIKAADGVTDLYYRMVLPHALADSLSRSDAAFVPKGKYPTVVYVYGGPHAHNVDASWHWHSRSWETYMSQRGYILFILDNRGSENRGRDFEQATFRQLGQVEIQDQMKGVEFLKSLPFVDAERLGVHGWSYGGFMTISLMTHYPDVFKVGVAGGPVIDWKWYEVMYGERYMDTPQTNPDGYQLTSLIPQAKNLRGRLQIIIGGNDPTCVPQHTLSFLKACVEAGTQPDLFIYPGEGHNMMGHASVHLHERITRYFDDYLK